MSYADWDPVVLDKRGRRAPGESKEAALARAMRTGAATSEKKIDHSASSVARKLEEDTDHFART